jgi:hypothetical protein
MPDEDMAAAFAAMPKSDQELFKLAAADTAVTEVKRTPFSGDPSKRTINTPDEAQRFRMLFDNDQDFAKYYDFIQRERLMFETPTKVIGGKPDWVQCIWGTGISSLAFRMSSEPSKTSKCAETNP